jgi:anti-sigma regulatory factor (Ser/Thr protein kinase)
MLAVSEAAANAGVHGVPPIGLAVTVTGSDGPVVVECSVSDSGEGLPLVPAQAGPDDERGRGQQIIAALADRWGFYRLPQGGQLAWFEFTDVPVASVESGTGRFGPTDSWRELPGEVLAS